MGQGVAPFTTVQTNSTHTSNNKPTITTTTTTTTTKNRTVDDDANVRVDFVYEPPQQGSSDRLVLERGTPEEAQVDFLAELMGLKKVGWVFSQANKERGFIVSCEEVMAMAAMQVRVCVCACAVAFSSCVLFL